MTTPKTMRSLLAFTATACLTALAANAQEYVRDGSFDELLFLNWRSGGPAVNPHREVFDTTGVDNPSNAFTLQPTTNPPYWIEQDLTVPAGETLLLTVDAADSHSSGNFPGNLVRLWVVDNGSTLLQSSDFRLRAVGAGVYRHRLAALWRPQGTSITLRITFWGGASPQPDGPRTFIDNVSCVPFRAPLVAFRGERRLGATNTLDVIGVPGPYAVYVAPALARVPLSIPGGIGRWYLDTTSMILVFHGGLSTLNQVRHTFEAPDVPAVRGIPLWWQGGQVDTSGSQFQLLLGNHSLQAFF